MKEYQRIFWEPPTRLNDTKKSVDSLDNKNEKVAQFFKESRERRQDAARRLPPLSKGYRDPQFRGSEGNSNVPS